MIDRQHDQHVQFTIMDRPLDYPDSVIVVRWRIDRNPPERLPSVWTFDSIAKAREAIMAVAPVAVWIPRDESDVLSIVETWW